MVSDSGVLTLNVSDPGWLVRRPGPLRRAFLARTMDDLVPDHDYRMHLYMIRQPGLDVVYHVHPEQIESGVVQFKLPSMPAGTYRVYADIVHANGFPETMTTTFALPEARKGPPLCGDDSNGTAASWDKASSAQTVFSLPDGDRMEWLGGEGPLKANQPILFRFRLLDGQGGIPDDMQFYMGMLGHVAFVKSDGSVFTHIHPTGSVSMAAFMLAQNQIQDGRTMTGMDMSGMDMPEMAHSATKASALPNEVTFPYGFAAPGRYRIMVQMKDGNTIETGMFDADAQ